MARTESGAAAARVAREIVPLALWMGRDRKGPQAIWIGREIAGAHQARWSSSEGSAAANASSSALNPGGGGCQI